MKTLLLPVMALAALCLSFSKTKTFVPPGTVQISDSLFADKTEISNLAWQEYELWTKTQYGSHSKEHLATLPDTLVWREKLSYNEPYVEYYYRHPAYKNFPVVGISYEQALAYCSWRTQQVKTQLSAKKDVNHQSFEYRLPSKKEWELLAASSTEAIDKQGKDKKGNPIIVCVNPKPNSNGLSGKYPDVTAPVDAHPKNALGLYNTAGNVAEMISEKGICKGGGWRNALEDCRPAVDAHYSKPSSWIGFRCVCVVKNHS